MRRALLLAATLFAWVRPLEADLPGYDDAYYARKALEVARTGEWLALPFNGSPTFDNPPLGIWSESLVFLLLGPSDAAARLPSAAYGVLTALVLFSWLRRRFLSPQAAFLGSAIFISNPLYLKYLRRAMLDMGLLFWSVAGAWCAERKPLSRPMHVLSGVAFGLAFLTKSALGLVVPVALVLGWLWEGAEGRKRLRAWALPASGGFLLVVGPWLAAMVSRFGEPFLGGHFVRLLWQEGVLGASDTSRAGTLGELALALLPASALFAAAAPTFLVGEARSNTEARPALLWGLVPVILLLAFGARKLWYFLPAVPGLAAVAGLGLLRWTEGSPRSRRALLKGVQILWLAAGAAVIMLPVPLHRDRTADVRAAAAEVRARTAAATPVRLFFPGEGCRWDVRNAFLWYSDRPVEGCTGESVADLARSSGRRGRRIWVLTTPAGSKGLWKAGLEPRLWFERGDLALVSLDGE